MSDIMMGWKNEYGNQFSDLLNAWDEMGIGQFIRLGRAQKLLSLGLAKPGMIYLSIGGGYGDLEVLLMEQLGAKVVMIEPSPNLMAAFKEKARAAGVSEQVLDFHEGSFQTYTIKHRFDLITAFHSWYYIGKDQAQLDRALSSLAPGGALYIEQSGSRGVSAALHGLLNTQRGLWGDDLAKWVRETGHACKEIPFDEPAPREQLLEGGQPMEWVRRLAAYQSHTPWDELTDETRAAISALLNKEGLIRSDVGIVIPKAA